VSDLYLGQRLVEAGRISTKQLRNAVMAQILDIMGEVMAWEFGAFHFDDLELPFAIPDDTLIRTQSVLLEAHKTADELGYAKSVFSEKNMVLAREEAAESGELEKNHSEVLDLVDGERTVEQILFSSSCGPRATASALTELMTQGAIRQSGIAVRGQKPAVPDLSSLPVAPQVPVRLFTIFNLPEGEEQLQAICDLLAQEPMLTAKVLKTLTLHNVEIRRSQMTIEDLVHLMGTFHLRCSLLPEATRGIFLSQQLCFWRECWEYSQIAAYLCQELAAVTDYMFPGEAYMAGLLHLLGMYLLLHAGPEKYLEVVQESLNNQRDLTEVEEEVYGITHTRMGSIHAQKWKFPRMLLLAIKHHRYRLNSKPANPLLHIVSVANGILHANDFTLGYQEGMDERFEYSLKCLRLDREQALDLYREAYQRTDQGHYLERVAIE
jgi:HD-like signal output (HDOD) protein